jgi:hypothetical protein
MVAKHRIMWALDEEFRSDSKGEGNLGATRSDSHFSCFT